MQEDRYAPKILKIVQSRFEISKKHRQSEMVLGASVETWLGRCYRMLHKQHEQDQMAAFPEMKRYFGLGTMRASAVTSWMRDLLVNSNDLPISAAPTDVPDLPKYINDDINKEMAALAAERFRAAGIDPMSPLPPAGLYEGLQILPSVSDWIQKEGLKLKETRRMAVKQKSASAMDKMYTLMRDYAYQGKWNESHTTYLHNGNVYPYKVLCGPDWVPQTRPVWVGNKYTYKNVVSPVWTAPSPHDCYFSPDAKSADTGGWFIEKKSKSRADLLILRQLPAYKESEIDAVLESFSSRGRGWMALDYSTVERANTWVDQENIDVLRHVGQISGRELSEVGMTGYDKHEMYETDIEWIENRLIKCSVVKSPSGQRGYYSTSFKRLSDSWAGASPLMYLFDAQITLNQWQFMLNRNFYASSGPMMEVHAGRIDSASDFFWEPYRTFTANAKNKSVTGEGNALQMHRTDSQYQAQFSTFMQRLRLADYECGIPSEAYGPSLPVGGDQTLGEITLRWGASLRGIKDSVLNDDEWVVQRTFTQLYEQLMANEKDQSIKADALIKATGASGLLQREMIEAKREKMFPLLQMAAQASPDKYGKAFDAVMLDQFKAFGYDDLLPQDPRAANEADALIKGMPGSQQMPQSQIPQELRPNL